MADGVMTGMTVPDTPNAIKGAIQGAIHGSIQAIWRIEAAKLIAGLTKMLGDVATAEELAQEAFVKALERWPSDGIPDSPGAWLMATAKRRAIDQIRRRAMLSRKHMELENEYESRQDPVLSIEAALDDEIGDNVLTLMFCACHPLLTKEGRIALALRLIGGLSTDEIGRAFLVPEATIAQRIVRAKRTLRDAGVPFEVPRGADRVARMQPVLEVIYLIFNEGYAATSGEDWLRSDLCAEALRLGRRLAGLAPDDPEVHGLVALMEFQASRFAARADADGNLIMLPKQDRRLWDRLHVRLGLEALTRAHKISDEAGPYLLQAAITACHSRAVAYEETDWREIERLYGILAQVMPTPVVELNRAVAVAMASGPAEGLRIADALLGEPTMKAYHYLPSIRGDFLFKLGKLDEARGEFLRAAAMAGNGRERDFLKARAAECDAPE